MQIRNNEIFIHRGENWTMRKRIENRDGSPYVISSELLNPHWLVTVASSRYTRENIYILNKWLELKDFPRFYSTVPIKLTDINPDYTFDNTTIPSGYEGDKTLGYANRAIFYEKDENSVIKYKYWEYINNIEDDYSGRWVDYYCPITTTFTSDITKDWIEQNYFYSIRLVGGERTEGDKPIIVDYSYEILTPTKLFVQSELKGGIL